MTAAGELVGELRLLRADLVACRRTLDQTLTQLRIALALISASAGAESDTEAA